LIGVRVEVGRVAKAVPAEELPNNIDDIITNVNTVINIDFCRFINIA
jgi:hypothetical protein